MNSVTSYRNPASNLVPQNIDEALRLAQAMSTMKGLPEWLHDSPSDCLQVVELAMRWGMSPFAVAQCVSLIHGKQMVEGKLVAAVVETSGVMATRFVYTHTGSGDDRAVTVSARLQDEGKPRELTVVLRDVRTYDKNGKPNKQWTGGQVDQQLCYAGVRTWARRHTPALMLGVYSREEFDAPQEGQLFSGPTIEAEAEPALSARPVADAPSARDAINAEVRMAKLAPTYDTPEPPAESPAPPDLEPARDTRMVDWVADTIARFERCDTGAAMFALIDEIKPDRDALREQAPELDKCLARIVKQTNARLHPKPEDKPTASGGGVQGGLV